MAKLGGGDERVTIRTLASKCISNREIARQLSVTEGAVRYQLRRMRDEAVDGRADQQPLAARFIGAVEEYLTGTGQLAPANELVDQYGGFLWSVGVYACDQ